MHCFMPWGIGAEFCWVPSHCGHYWNGVLDKLAKQGAMKNMSELTYYYLTLSSYETTSVQHLKRQCTKNLNKVNMQHFLVQGT